MKVEVVTLKITQVGIIGDLTSRRGQVQGQDTRGNAIAIEQTCRWPTMFGLYQHTAFDVVGRGENFTMQFSHSET